MRRIRWLWLFVLILALLAGGEWWLFGSARIETGRIVLMPDSALSSEAHFIRHRSLTDLFEVFGQGPGLLPYFPSDYVYGPPPYLHATQEMR